MFPTNIASTIDFYVLCKRGGITIFRQISQYRKKIVEEPFCNSKKSLTRTFMHRRGGITVFAETFCLTVPKVFVRIPSVFQKSKGIEKFLHRKGVSLFSLETFLSHSAKKLRKGTILCFRNILVGKIYE